MSQHAMIEEMRKNTILIGIIGAFLIAMPVVAQASTVSAFEDRTCERVTRHYGKNMTAWLRLQERLEKRFGFTCMADSSFKAIAWSETQLEIDFTSATEPIFPIDPQYITIQSRQDKDDTTGMNLSIDFIEKNRSEANAFIIHLTKATKQCVNILDVTIRNLPFPGGKKFSGTYTTDTSCWRIID